MAAKLIPSVLGAFCEQYPNVEVSLIDDNAAGVEARLLSGEVDLALGNPSHLDEGGIDFTPLLSLINISLLFRLSFSEKIFLLHRKKSS